jgi:hypothetical protein
MVLTFAEMPEKTSNLASPSFLRKQESTVDGFVHSPWTPGLRPG